MIINSLSSPVGSGHYDCGTHDMRDRTVIFQLLVGQSSPQMEKKTTPDFLWEVDDVTKNLGHTHTFVKKKNVISYFVPKQCFLGKFSPKNQETIFLGKRRETPRFFWECLRIFLGGGNWRKAKIFPKKTNLDEKRFFRGKFVFF